MQMIMVNQTSMSFLQHPVLRSNKVSSRTPCGNDTVLFLSSTQGVIQAVNRSRVGESSRVMAKSRVSETAHELPASG